MKQLRWPITLRLAAFAKSAALSASAAFVVSVSHPLVAEADGPSPTAAVRIGDPAGEWKVEGKTRKGKAYTGTASVTLPGDGIKWKLSDGRFGGLFALSKGDEAAAAASIALGTSVATQVTIVRIVGARGTGHSEYWSGEDVVEVQTQWGHETEIVCKDRFEGTCKATFGDDAEATLTLTPATSKSPGWSIYTVVAEGEHIWPKGIALRRGDWMAIATAESKVGVVLLESAAKGRLDGAYVATGDDAVSTHVLTR